MSGLARIAAGLALLLTPAPALAADPIEQFHIAPTLSQTTKKALKGGAVYTMEISGTRREDFRSGGDLWTSTSDAFYCFASKTESDNKNDPVCHGDPQKEGPQPVNPVLVRTLVAESSNYPLAAITTEGEASSEINSTWKYPPFRTDHTYTVKFKPHATGKFHMIATETCAGAKCSGEGWDVKIFPPEGEEDPCAPKAGSAGPEVRVIAVNPDVRVHKAGTPEDCWIELQKDTVLQAGDEIGCDPDGVATLQLGTSWDVVVKNTTQLKIAAFFTEGGPIKTEILLKMGEVAAKVHKSEATKSDFRIKSPTAVASVRGTDFSVFYDPGSGATLTTVREGVVEVDPAKAGLATAQVPAGKEVEVTSSAISKVVAPGKAGARHGVGRHAALTRVLKIVARANGPCHVSTPRLNAFAVKPVSGGWAVTIKLTGKHKGTARWTVKGKRTKAKNALAKRVTKRCS